MTRKEDIIKYLGEFGRAGQIQIATNISAPLPATSTKLTDLRHEGLVQSIRWPDGNRYWSLTEKGYRRYDYYIQRDKKRTSDM